jgi:tRNA G18 (ribose-2'-O)-methylase SpoU
MSAGSQVRHRDSTALARPRELVVACAPFRSHVNLATIVRIAGCCAVERVIACGSTKVDPKVARDSLEHVTIERRRTLAPVMRSLAADGYAVVALEQATGSKNLHGFRFSRRTALVIGNERLGLSDEELSFADAAVEIPVWGMPRSYNVASATAMALYEYCRQFPSG